jgi:hypothetical protein
MDRAWGIDVSRFQPGISFAAARAAGASFAFVRASTGAEADLAFTDHVRRGRGELLLGAYHALQPGIPAGVQALALYVALGMADGFRLPLPPALDVEKTGIDEVLVLTFLEALSRRGRCSRLSTPRPASGTAWWGRGGRGRQTTSCGSRTGGPMRPSCPRPGGIGFSGSTTSPRCRSGRVGWT